MSRYLMISLQAFQNEKLRLLIPRYHPGTSIHHLYALKNILPILFLFKTGLAPLTCIVVGAAGVLVFIIHAILGGEPDGTAVSHHMRQVTVCQPEVDRVVRAGIFHHQVVLHHMPPLLRVLCLDLQYRVILPSYGVDLLQAEPELSCERHQHTGWLFKSFLTHIHFFYEFTLNCSVIYTDWA